MSDMQSRTVHISNNKGLHARAAAKFVKTSEQFKAEINVSHGGMEVSGRSIMGLMMLAARNGADIVISARGHDSDQALQALAELVENRFGEE